MALSSVYAIDIFIQWMPFHLFWTWLRSIVYRQTDYVYLHICISAHLLTMYKTYIVCFWRWWWAWQKVRNDVWQSYICSEHNIPCGIWNKENNFNAKMCPKCLAAFYFCVLYFLYLLCTISRLPICVLCVHVHAQ